MDIIKQLPCYLLLSYPGMTPKQKHYLTPCTVREHPNLEDFPKFGEIANFKIREFPQIWRNGYFSFLFLGGKEGSKYAVIIHGHAPV